MDDIKFEPITIGISCYNAEDTIARAINSALKQDYPEFEILVVDDCSSDDSKSIIENLAKDHKKIRIIVTNKNGGPALTRQTIVENACHDIITFFDDDDESLPPRLRTQYKTLVNYEQKTHQNLIACYASGTRLYPNGYAMHLAAIGSNGTPPVGDVIADRLLIFKSAKGYDFGGGIPTCSLMIRKSTIEAVGGFDVKMRRVEDADFAIRLGILGGHFIGCKDNLFLQHATGGEDKSPEVNLKYEQILALKHKPYLDKTNNYHYAYNWPRLRYLHFKKNYLMFAIVLLGIAIRKPKQSIHHLMQTGPRRLLHELRFKKKKQ